jgi:spermidine/putrescine transport system permease protein
MVKKILAKTYVYLIMLLMYLPIIVLIVFSFSTATNVGTWESSTGNPFQLYIDLFNNKALMSAVGNTVLIAFVSAIVSTILGTLGAIGAYYSRNKTKKIIDTMTQLPVVNAEIVMALSLAVLFVALGFSFNFGTLLVGHVVLTVAFVYLNVLPKLTQMDPNTYEAALDLGAKPHYALWKVIFPEILPGIVSGFLISITLSLDDFVITQYLKQPSFETISTYIQKIVAKHPIPAEVRALTTLIFLAVLTVVIFLTVYNNKKNKISIKRIRGGK